MSQIKTLAIKFLTNAIVSINTREKFDTLSSEFVSKHKHNISLLDIIYKANMHLEHEYLNNDSYELICLALANVVLSLDKIETFEEIEAFAVFSDQENTFEQSVDFIDKSIAFLQR